MTVAFFRTLELRLSQPAFGAACLGLATKGFELLDQRVPARGLATGSDCGLDQAALVARRRACLGVAGLHLN